MDRSLRAGTGFVLTLLPTLAAVSIAQAEPGDLNNDYEINLLDLGPRASAH